MPSASRTDSNSNVTARGLRRSTLFELALFLLPFENFFFAPSKGWAAIAPIGFFVYVALNPERWITAARELRFALLFLGLALFLTSINFFVFSPDGAVLFDVSRALALGVTFLFALTLYFRDHDPGRALRIVAIAYAVSFGFGVLQLIALRFDIEPLIEALHALGKRSVLRGQRRVQFTFTEPAYLGMHLYGVLLPLVFFFRGHPESRSVQRVLFTFVIGGLLFGSSLKFRLDTVVVAILLAAFGVSWLSKRTRQIAWIAAVTLVVLGTWFSTQNPRVQRLVQRGFRGDASVAARVFRIEASLVGYRHDPVACLTGHGLSNVWMPFRSGFHRTRMAWGGQPIAEIERLRFRHPASLLSMPIRIVSELGLIVFAALLVALYDRQHRFLLAVLLWLYLGFDSYAFYSIWLYVYFVKVRPLSRSSA